jgi:hypothetical protein
MSDENKIENGEEKRGESLEKKLKESNFTFDMLEELLDETTSKVIEDIGLKRNTKVAGVYGDGNTYGTGVEENEYNVIVTGKPSKFNSSLKMIKMNYGTTSGTLEKQIFLGAKRLESQVDFEIKGEILHIQYRSPEAGFFRGVGEYGKTFMVKEKLIVPLKDARKEVGKLFKDAARREVGYLTNTKLGVEDRMDAGTTSIVENLNMKKLSIKSLLDNINESEDFEKLPSNVEPNIEKVKNLNTNKIEDVKGDKFLLFDDEEMNEEDLMEALHNLDKGNMSKVFKDELEKEFGTRELQNLTPAERKDSSRLAKVFNSIDKDVVSSDEVNEITTAGPAGAGAGRYDAKNFAVAKRGNQTEKSKGGKKSDAGAPYNIPVNDPFYESVDSLNESRKDVVSKRYEQTSYAKSFNYKRPKVDKDYNIVEEKDTNSSKPYTQVVKIDPNYHPQGMPFVKPNSKEEYERTVNGDSDKLKRMGINESEKEKNERLRKRKFSTLLENEEKGINKRYIVTEKTSEEYEKDRWSKLATFNKFETIKEAEELNTIFENVDYNEFYDKPETLIKESEEKELIKESAKTIEVEKPGSMFGIVQKFYEKDFLNENKKFILDLNSMVFVPNPNSK